LRALYRRVQNRSFEAQSIQIWVQKSFRAGEAPSIDGVPLAGRAG